METNDHCMIHPYSLGVMIQAKADIQVIPMFMQGYYISSIEVTAA